MTLQDLSHKFSTMFLAVFINLQSRHINKQWTVSYNTYVLKQLQLMQTFPTDHIICSEI